jgi:uncharacterized phage-associated protein
MIRLNSLFDLDKTIQVTAHLLKQNENKMNYLRLLKFLYLINRESLQKKATLIVYDRACALPRGPILSTVYNLIKERDTQSRQWQRYIETGQYNVFLGNDPGDDELSKSEKNIIESVFHQYKGLDNAQLIEFTHTLPEWKRYEPKLMSAKNKNSFHIALKEIVNAIVEQRGDETLWDRVGRNVAEDMFFADQIIDDRI